MNPTRAQVDNLLGRTARMIPYGMDVYSDDNNAAEQLNTLYITISGTVRDQLARGNINQAFILAQQGYLDVYNYIYRNPRNNAMIIPRPNRNADDDGHDPSDDSSIAYGSIKNKLIVKF